MDHGHGYGKWYNQHFKNMPEGRGDYEDDEPMVIPGAAQSFFNNKLYAQDPRLMSHAQGAYTLLHPDGSRTTEVVHSIRGPENERSFTPSFWEGARFLSVKTYLTFYAVRTEPDYGYNEDHMWGTVFSTNNFNGSLVCGQKRRDKGCKGIASDGFRLKNFFCFSLFSLFASGIKKH